MVQCVYALRVLRNHGIPAASTNDVFRSTVLAKLFYTARLHGRASAQRPTVLDSTRSCAGVSDSGTAAETPAITELFDEADETLFGSILANSNHVLQPYLPELSLSQYNLRQIITH